MSQIEASRLAAVHAAELERFARDHPRSRELFERARASLVGGVPMTWMAKWVGGTRSTPPRRTARGSRTSTATATSTSALGDTGAMAGHRRRRPSRPSSAGWAAGGDDADAPHRGRGVGRRGARAPLRPAVVELRADRDRREPLGAAAVPRRHRAAVRARLQRLLPRLRRRDLRHPRRRRRPRVARRATSASPSTRPRPRGSCEFNDLGALERTARRGDVACVLAEPALTNIGIVLPERRLPRRPARGVRRARGRCCHRRDAHHLRGARRLHRGLGLRPTSSRSARRSPAASRSAPTASAPRSPRASRPLDAADLVDVGGVGGTLAGNALSLAAVRATLGEVLTDGRVRRR